MHAVITDGPRPIRVVTIRSLLGLIRAEASFKGARIPTLKGKVRADASFRGAKISTLEGKAPVLLDPGAFSLHGLLPRASAAQV